jgi:thiol-disulfide isomerase/thioredoxin
MIMPVNAPSAETQPGGGRAFLLRYRSRVLTRRRMLAALLAAAASPAGAQGYLRSLPAGPAVPARPTELKPWDGVVTPPLELADLEGKSHRLADYRGKVVLVNFWATWCTPCRDEMPSIERLRNALAGRPFAVLAVNVGETERAARAFLETMPLRFTILLDRNVQVSRAWGARILPASYLVAPNGAIRYSYFGELDWARDDVISTITKMMI